MRKGADLSYLVSLKPDPESMKWDHAMDISGSVYARMKELGIGKKELAKRMGVNPSVVTRIIKGKQNITLGTLSKLEHALDVDMSEGFRHPVSWTAEEAAVERSTFVLPAEKGTSRFPLKLRQPAAMNENLTLQPQGA